jgi:hypothetical protein
MSDLSMMRPRPGPFGHRHGGGEDIPRGWVVSELRLPDRAETDFSDLVHAAR